MLRKDDQVIFNIGLDNTIYNVITDEYELNGVKVVDLEGYSGEVNVEYLEDIQ